MIPPGLLLMSIRERQRELWAEAEAYRRRQELRHPPSWLHDRCLRTLGGWFIAWGVWLQRQARPAEAPGCRVTATRHATS